jgi:hypothetical protein
MSTRIPTCSSRWTSTTTEVTDVPQTITVDGVTRERIDRIAAETDVFEESDAESLDERIAVVVDMLAEVTLSENITTDDVDTTTDDTPDGVERVETRHGKEQFNLSERL